MLLHLWAVLFSSIEDVISEVLEESVAVTLHLIEADVVSNESFQSGELVGYVLRNLLNPHARHFTRSLDGGVGFLRERFGDSILAFEDLELFVHHLSLTRGLFEFLVQVL